MSKRKTEETSDNSLKRIDIQEDVQEDFSLKLDGIPLLKKFSSAEFNTPRFYDSMLKFDGMMFVITFGDNVNITPYKERRFLPYPPISLDVKIFIQNQLIMSGILSYLRLYQIENPTYNIVIRLNCSNRTISYGNYHNDSVMYQILKYYKNDRTVLGSELLFMDQRSAIIHRRMTPEGTFENYPLISDIQEKINEMYDHNHIPSVVLRGLYNSGDTLVFNDMLIKHAAINERSKITNGVLKIRIGDMGDEDITVCNSRIETLPRHITGRGIIGISVWSSNETNGVNAILTSHLDNANKFSFELMETEPVKEVDFDIDKYKEFLLTLQHAEFLESGSCLIKDTTILSRGGKSKRKKTKEPKKQKNAER